MSYQFIFAQISVLDMMYQIADCLSSVTKSANLICSFVKPISSSSHSIFDQLEFYSFSLFIVNNLKYKNCCMVYQFIQIKDFYLFFCQQYKFYLMGSSCCRQGERCHVHQDKIIEFICIQKGCIQPLCQKCISKHRQNHQLVGHPPNIVKYSVIQQVFQRKLKQKQQNQKQQKNSHNYEFASNQFKLKELTNQYFTRRYKSLALNKADQVHLKGVLGDLQLFQKLKTTPVKQKFMQFLKQNLQLNQQVISKDYSHLYN